jgi:uncharacterized peroxidase-related enzyme
MSFQVHTVERAPAAARETLGKLVQSYGFLPNLAGAIAESSAVLTGLVGLMSAFDAQEMSLAPVERQVVLLAVSVKNKCEYCAAAHGMLAHIKGLDRDDVVRLQQGLALGNARLEALRRFAETIVENRGWVGEPYVQKFVDSGFTRAQVLEVVMGVALKTLTNYVNHIAKPPVNEQFAGFLPSWPKAA